MVVLSYRAIPLGHSGEFVDDKPNPTSCLESAVSPPILVPGFFDTKKPSWRARLAEARAAELSPGVEKPHPMISEGSDWTRIPDDLNLVGLGHLTALQRDPSHHIWEKLFARLSTQARSLHQDMAPKLASKVIENLFKNKTVKDNPEVKLTSYANRALENVYSALSLRNRDDV